jgi:hypothetical protein
MELPIINLLYEKNLLLVVSSEKNFTSSKPHLKGEAWRR